MTLLIHEGKKMEDLFLKYGTIYDPRSKDNVDLKIVQTSSSANYKAEKKISGTKVFNICMIVSYEN